MGVSEALRPQGVFIQAHEPASSPAISGGDRGPFLIQGWTGSVMPHWSPEKVDGLEPIGDEEALAMTRRLANEEGIFAASRPVPTSSVPTGWRIASDPKP